MFGRNKRIEEKLNKLLTNDDEIKNDIQGLLEDILVDDLKHNKTNELIKETKNILTKVDLIMATKSNNTEVINNLNSLVKTKNSQIFEAEEQIEILVAKLKESEHKRSVQNGEKGNLTRKYNELLSKTEELEVKLKNSDDKIAELNEKLKNSYTRSILPPDEPTNEQKTKLKNRVKNSQVKAILKSKNEDKEVTQNV